MDDLEAITERVPFDYAGGEPSILLTVAERDALVSEITRLQEALDGNNLLHGLRANAERIKDAEIARLREEGVRLREIEKAAQAVELHAWEKDGYLLVRHTDVRELRNALQPPRTEVDR